MAKQVYLVATVLLGLFLGTLAVFNGHALHSLNRFSGFAATTTSAVYAVKHWVIIRIIELIYNYSVPAELLIWPDVTQPNNNHVLTIFFN